MYFDRLAGARLRAAHRETGISVIEPLTDEQCGALDAAVQNTVRAVLPEATGRAEARIAAAIEAEASAAAMQAAACPAPDRARSEVCAVPREALEGLVKVARYVSLGRGGVGHQPDGALYPDAAARFALGALDDAGIELDGGKDA